MDYSMDFIKTVAECDELLTKYRMERSRISLKKMTEERRLNEQIETVEQIRGKLGVVDFEMDNISQFVFSMPDSLYKRDNLTKLKKLEWRKQVLANKKQDTDKKDQFFKEMDIASLGRRLVWLEELLAAIEARKAVLQAA